MTESLTLRAQALVVRLHGVGVPIGIWAAHRPTALTPLMRPVLESICRAADLRPPDSRPVVSSASAMVLGLIATVNLRATRPIR